MRVIPRLRAEEDQPLHLTWHGLQKPIAESQNRAGFGLGEGGWKSERKSSRGNCHKIILPFRFPLRKRHGVQLKVAPALIEQFGVRAFFEDAPVIHDDDLVRFGDGREAMGDDEGGAAFAQPLESQ